MRYFLVVAEELHFTRAAERLHITPSPLSRQIRAFERQMGGPLFVRHYHAVTLTPLGAALVEPVRDILQRIDSLRTIADRSRGDPAAVRVGVSAIVPSVLLDHFTEAIADIEPDSRCFLAGSSTELVELLADDALDLALVHLPLGDDRVESQPWTTYPLAVALRADDPLARQDEINPEDMSARTVIIGGLAAASTQHQSLVLQMTAIGIRDVQDLADAAAFDVQLAAHVRHKGYLTIIDLVPGSTSERLFAPPQFAIRPIRGAPLSLTVALAWPRGRRAANARLDRAADLLDRVRPSAAEPGAA